MLRTEMYRGPNLSIVHPLHAQRLMYGVKQPFEWLTEQQGLLLKGFSLQVLSQAFHHNRAQLRQGAGVGGICCTFPLLAPSLPPSLSAFLLPLFSSSYLCFSSETYLSYLGVKEGRAPPPPSQDYDWYVHGHTSNTFTEVKGI